MNYLQILCVGLAVLTLAEVTRGEKAETPKQKPFKNENICNTQPDGAIIANSNDCNKFAICVQQKPYEYNCDEGYHYDAATRHCVLGASCSSVSNKPAACAEGNIRPVQDDCNTFEACDKGQYKKLKCPPTYYFNVPQAICMPFKYDAQYKCNCLMPEYTILENKNNCGTYFVCHGKSAVLENCPLGQYYNAELNTCLNDLEGICLTQPSVAPGLLENLNINKTGNVESEAQAICKTLSVKGIHFHTFLKDCNSFYICVNDLLYTQYCPKGFYYDSDKNYCIIDAINKCSDTGDLIDTNLEKTEKSDVVHQRIFQRNKFSSIFLSFKQNLIPLN